MCRTPPAEPEPVPDVLHAASAAAAATASGAAIEIRMPRARRRIGSSPYKANAPGGWLVGRWPSGPRRWARRQYTEYEDCVEPRQSGSRETNPGWMPLAGAPGQRGGESPPRLQCRSVALQIVANE